MTKNNSSFSSDDAILFLVKGGSVDDAIGRLVATGISQSVAKTSVDEARKAITLSADYVRDEQLNKAVSRIETLHKKSFTAKDYKTALQAQKELNRLLGLYGSKQVESSDGSECEKQIHLIEGYILPLNLADETLPLVEHVRIASERLRQQSPIRSTS